MKDNNVSKEFISVAEAAQILGYSRQHVLRLIESGQIKATKVGRNFVVEKNSLPHIFSEEITASEKKEIDDAVKKVVKEYGEALKKLGEE